MLTIEKIDTEDKAQVKRFKSNKEMLQWVNRIGVAYNASFVNNWEYYPLTQREIDFVVENIMMVADYRLIKNIVHGEDVVGFLFAFPDVSSALQRAKGRLHPLSLVNLLLDMKRTNQSIRGGVAMLSCMRKWDIPCLTSCSSNMLK